MAAKQKYDERFVKIAKVLCMRGGTDEDLADAFEVSTRTINRWKKDYPEFAEALAAGKEYADAEVELSLYKRAKGSKKKTKVTRKIIEMDKDGNTKPAKIETVETEEDIIPDVGACCFWLKNRRPDMWRDKQEIGLYEIEDMEGIEADIYGGEE